VTSLRDYNAYIDVVTKEFDMAETVGIRELKARLSEYLKRARAGHRIVVTDRGRGIAALGPVSEERRTLESLMASGHLRWTGRKPAGLAGVRSTGKSVAAAVAEDRR
jgi:prevent-host-death family protein